MKHERCIGNTQANSSFVFDQYQEEVSKLWATIKFLQADDDDDNNEDGEADNDDNADAAVIAIPGPFFLEKTDELSLRKKTVPYLDV